MKNKKLIRKKEESAVTLVALVITIIVMLLLGAVAISLTIGENGIFQKSEQSVGTHNKQEATEKINLKITSSQMRVYTESKRMPTLQEIANDFCKDNEVEYVELVSKRTANINQVEIGSAKSFFTKLKQYPYEFEINSSLQLASIDGTKIVSTEETQLPEGYIKPSGTIEITQNKEYDVSQYEKANVNVPTYEEKGVTWNCGETTVTNVNNMAYFKFTVGFEPSITQIYIDKDESNRVSMVCFGTSGNVFASGTGNGKSWSSSYKALNYTNGIWECTNFVDTTIVGAKVYWVAYK